MEDSDDEEHDERKYVRWLNGRRNTKIVRLAVLNGLGAFFHFVNMMIEIAVGARFNMHLAVVSRQVRNATQPDSPTSFEYYYETAYWFPITIAVFMIHVMSLAFHLFILAFLVADIFQWYNRAADWYLRGIFRCRAPWRWLEYFFSASLQIWCMCISIGIRDSQLVLAVVILCATTIMFGWIAEIVSSRVVDNSDLKNRRWKGALFGEIFFDRVLYCHAVAYIPYVAMWTIILYTFQEHKDAMGDTYPSYIDTLIALTVIGFSSFGFIQSANQILPNGPSWYEWGEVAYVVMSFATKAQMVLIIVFNSLVPGSKFDRQLGANFF